MASLQSELHDIIDNVTDNIGKDEIESIASSSPPLTLLLMEQYWLHWKVCPLTASKHLYKCCCQHVEEPEDVWTATMNPNADGYNAYTASEDVDRTLGMLAIEPGDRSEVGHF